MGTTLHAFPSSDSAFRAFAEAAFEELEPSERTPEALQRLVRQRYPAAVVNVQTDLGRRPSEPALWYVFRSGPPYVEPPAPDGELSWPAWGDLDEDRRFLSVTPELAEIAEVPAGRMVGRTVDDFTNPDDPTVRQDVGRLWEQFRAAGSLASTMRFNHADGRRREVEYRLEAHAGGPGRHRLWARVLFEEPV